MFRPRRMVVVVAIFSSLFLAGAGALNADTHQGEKSTGVVVPTPQAEKDDQEKKRARATEVAKQLLLAMDANKNGKVSKEEWMKFMEAEFDRLDTGHSGQLDVKELTQSRMRIHPSVGHANVGK